MKVTVIFMRHLVALGKTGVTFENKVVMEFGPGSSYGMGIAALLSGAKRYYALDLIYYTSDIRNLAIFDEMVKMFKTRAPVPIAGSCAKMFPFIDDPAFPKSALPDALLERTLNPNRIRAIRRDLQIRGNAFIRPRSSTHIHGIVLDEPADIILSELVLEHVDDLKSTYEAFRRWLAPKRNNGAFD